MGNWNRRWMPRRRYHREDPDSYHRPYYTQTESSGLWQSNVPSWEKQFCTLVGSIPWQKVMVAKRYMNCHDDVVKWNDSASEEAFNNAKKRFWAAINGLPCDIPVPDPDMYIDEIDWNPHIDPELISDLDREYFNPDEGGKNNMVETADQNPHNSVSGCAVGWHGNLSNGDNPWEGCDLKGTEALKNVAQGWNPWDDSINESRNLNNVDNPWEQSYTRVNVALEDNAWGSCRDKSWGWNQRQACDQQSKTFDRSREHDCQNIGSTKEKGWGDAGNNSWSWDRWETNVLESKKFGSGDTPWARNQGNGGGKDRGWGDCGDKKTWGWKQLGNQNNEPKHLDSRTNGGAWGALSGGCRKREASHQYSSRYKRSRFQGDDYDTGHHWGKGRSQKRVSFA